jgi:CheY-like chemotaxis protein
VKYGDYFSLHAKIGDAACHQIFATAALSQIAFEFLGSSWYSPGPQFRVSLYLLRERPMNLRILIVDDNETMRRITAAIVGSHPGWTICGEAADGVSGIRKFQQLNPDLVLLDFGMPGINGIETAEWMSTANPAPRLILFTVWDVEGLEPSAAKAGICAVVRKAESWTLITSIETAFSNWPDETVQ